MTPLHWAVETKKRDIIDLLLKYGADPCAASKFFKTPMSIALETNQPDVFQELLTWKMKIGDPEQQSATDALVNEMKQDEASASAAAAATSASASGHGRPTNQRKSHHRQISETGGFGAADDEDDCDNKMRQQQQQQNSIIDDFDETMMIASSPDSSSQPSTIFSNQDNDEISKNINCK